MKRWKIVALTCAVVACLSAGLVGCQSSAYKPEAKSQTVPSSALGQTGTLRVGVNASSAPLAGKTSSSSHIVGIDADVAAYLADELGLKVELVDVGSDPSSALNDKKVDIVLGVDNSDSEADFWRSSAYLQTGVALFGSATEDSVPAVDSKPKIAAQASSKSSWRVTNLFGDDSLVSQTDLKSAFGALANGTARYVAADAVIGTYVSYSNGYSDKIVALLQDPSGYCAGVAKSNTDLQNAIGPAVNKLVNGGVMDIIEKKWLGTTLSVDSVTVVKSASGDDKKKSDKKSDESKSDESKSDESKSDEGEASSAGDAAAGESAATQGAAAGDDEA